MLRKESSNMSLLGAIIVLAGLVLPLIIPTQTEVQAEMFQNNPETVSKDSPQTVRTDITTGQLTFIPEDLPVAGDFNGDGVDSIGIWHTPGVSFFLTNDNTNFLPEIPFGSLGDQPVIGDWDGKPNQ